jgi:endonuclease/exonuclease/phosphatase (EEP) superfamily protein YafD
LRRPLLAALTLAIAAAACASGPTHTGRSPEPGEAHLRVMTYNVNYGRAHDPLTIQAVGEGDADIILLQETTAAWEENLRASYSELYPHMVFHHSGGAGGLAVLSRYPLEETVLPATEGWFPAMKVYAATPLGRVQCLSVHLRPPVSDTGSVVSGYFTTGSIRSKEIDRFARELEEDVPTIVAGDFNESSGEALDHMASKGFRLAAPMFVGEGVPTWRWNTSVGEINETLDHVLFDGLTAIDAQVLKIGRSDHLPIVVTFVSAANQPE